MTRGTRSFVKYTFHNIVVYWGKDVTGRLVSIYNLIIISYNNIFKNQKNLSAQTTTMLTKHVKNSCFPKMSLIRFVCTPKFPYAPKKPFYQFHCSLWIRLTWWFGVVLNFAGIGETENVDKTTPLSQHFVSKMDNVELSAQKSAFFSHLPPKTTCQLSSAFGLFCPSLND